MKKIRREQRKFEMDARYVDGEKVFERFFSTSGFWQKKNCFVEHGSLPALQRSAQKNKVKKQLSPLVRFLKQRRLLNFRIILKSENRSIQTSKKTHQKKGSIYIEVSGENTFTYLESKQNFSLLDLGNALDRHFIYLQKKIRQTNIQPDLLTLSPSAFGYFLHEGLGHRHESDDHETCLKFSSKRKANFAVFDAPGENHMLGFTPFDDFGTRGRSVLLFCGQTHKTQLLTAQSGNMRATGYEFHPLVRQRCLIVQTLKPAALPKNESRLHIEEIHQGSWDGETLELVVAKSVYISSSGKEWRMPSQTLRMRPEILLHMTAYGANELSHPPGGCHKDLQRGLDVSFSAPGAFINLKENNIPQQLLDIF